MDPLPWLLSIIYFLGEACHCLIVPVIKHHHVHLKITISFKDIFPASSMLLQCQPLPVITRWILLGISN